MVLLELNRDKLPFDIPEWEIVQRAVLHDLDKFRSGFASYSVESLLLNLKNDKKIKMLKKKYNSHDHQLISSHHTTYHQENNTFPSNLDICEMCCDWVASSRKHYNDKIRKEKKTLRSMIFCDKFKDVLDFVKPEINKFEAIIDLIENFNLADNFFDEQPEFVYGK
jgi:hypothetical protein